MTDERVPQSGERSTVEGGPTGPPFAVAQGGDLARLTEAVAIGGPTAREWIELPRSGRRLEVTRPVDTDALLDRVADDPEQNLPYWAEIWPSGIALADGIALRPDPLHGARVLELGCGLGVTAATALAVGVGAELWVTDYAAEALLFCRLNALRHSGREPVGLRANWRRPSGELMACAGDGFDVVLAADVLYEARDVAPLLGLVGRMVRPGGLLWLAEPGRPPAARFLAAAREQGWSGPSVANAGPWPDAKDAGVVVEVHELWRR